MTTREMYDDHRRRHPELYRDRASSCAVLEPPVCNDAVGTAAREKGNAVRIHVRVVSYRKRLLDPDNLCPKYFVDCLRYAGLIPDDRAEDISLAVSQHKVKLKSDERTDLEITNQTP